MFAEITAGLGSLNAAMGLLKTLNATANQAAINSVKLELQGHIFEAREALNSAREAHSASLERIRELEQQIAQFEDWKREAQRYELKAVGAAAFAYALKPGMENGEPAHWLCANCFEKRKKSIYQKLPGSIAQTHLNIPTSYECAACKSKISP